MIGQSFLTVSGQLMYFVFVFSPIKKQHVIVHRVPNFSTPWPPSMAPQQTALVSSWGPLSQSQSGIKWEKMETRAEFAAFVSLNFRMATVKFSTFLCVLFQLEPLLHWCLIA